jgi:hypothetical protein
MTAQTFWAEVKVGRKQERIGPFTTREMAYVAAWRLNSKAKSVCTGYGSEGPWFDIRWQTWLDRLNWPNAGVLT